VKKGAKFGLIGYPIAHSQSPELFRKAYGGRYAYDLIEEADFDRAWQRFLDGYDAVNVTAPFKEPALRRADLPAPECLKIGATNLLVKTPEGVKAWNSDYLGVLELLREEGLTEGVALVVGFGGAGKAAAAATAAAGLDTVVCNRTVPAGSDVRPLDELPLLAGVADVVVYTLPLAVPQMEGVRCACLLEANYRDPQYAEGVAEKYIPGRRWLEAQARTGYPLMTGETIVTQI